MKSKIEYPLLSHLKRGISAADAVELLSRNDCLTFPQLRSGLFPAANFDNLESDMTGMSNAWLRDSACIGLILLKDKREQTAATAVRGIMSRLHVIRLSLEKVIALGRAPDDDEMRPPISFTGQDSEPRYDWVNAQNDALGYSLQFIGAAATAGLLDINNEDRALIDLVTSYLEAVSYWDDSESGHWEEIKKVNASSIGTVISGLKSVQDLAADSAKIDNLINKGREALDNILPYESKTPAAERQYDSALIFLVEPQQVVTGKMADILISQSKQNLMGEYGFRRYNGDSYWGPDYREHFLMGDRAADFSDPKNMSLRDQYLTPGGEAQWTFIDPMVSAYYARRYHESGSSDDATEAEKFIIRSLRSLVTHKKESGETVWRMPELFFLERGQWVPNDHLGLLWGQANLLYGLTVYREVFGGSLIME